jgi:AraC family transcriptional regulator
MTDSKTVKLGLDNFVLRAQGRRHQVREFPGPLSIKTVVDGRVTWHVGGRDVLVDQCSFLVLSEGERYSMDIDVRVPVRTCCVFFQHGFVERVVHSLTCPEDRLLEDPNGGTGRTSFLSRLHARDDRVMPRMRAIASAGLPPTMWLEEQYLLLAGDLGAAYEETRRQIQRIPAVRAATRDEILRRLDRAREFMHAYCGSTMHLDEIAHAACLSTYHFHRTFSKAMGESPHTYLTRIRLDRARCLLEKRLSVTEVCGLVGFESLTSFSALFRRKFGFPPSQISKNREAAIGEACYF